MTVYDQMLKVLSTVGVRHIFGVPGDAINPLIDSIRRQKDIQFIHVAHEEAGALAASAQAKLTGRLAVCAGTVGPGAIHLLNGLYDAAKDRAPVLVITGQVPSDEKGFHYHQEVDLQRLYDDVTLFNSAVVNPAQMPRIALNACQAALYAGGVAMLSIPHDIATQSVESVEINLADKQRFHVLPESEKYRQVLEVIRQSNSPTILFGEGCRDAIEGLVAVSERLQAPLVNSLRAKDMLPGDHPRLAGGLGMLGSKGGLEAVSECDLLLVVGSDFPYREWYPDKTSIVRVDRDGTVFGRRTSDEIGLVSDAGVFLNKLLEDIPQQENRTHFTRVMASRGRWNADMERKSELTENCDRILPQGAIRAIGEAANDDAIFTCDTGAITAWAARHLRMRGSQRFTLSFNLATMAYALPAALGAQLSHPGQQVISLSGDGGFNMLMGDFLTAVKYHLPIKVFIFNNHKLGLIEAEQEAEGLPESETDLLNPDYALLAKSFGAEGFRVTRPDELKETVAQAFTTEGPCLVDIEVSGDELPIPPKIRPYQAMNFAKAKLKELFQ